MSHVIVGAVAVHAKPVCCTQAAEADDYLTRPSLPLPPSLTHHPQPTPILTLNVTHLLWSGCRQPVM